MKLVLFTQRIDHINSRKETRDSNDQNYVKLLEKCGYLPVSIPNVLITPDNQNEFCNEKINIWLNRINPDAILLSGGNNIGEYPNRDYTEMEILNFAKKKSLPVLGICRGMQLLALSEGTKLIPVKGHVGRKHFVKGDINQEVLCFHEFSIENVPKNFYIIAESEDGVIEAIKHKVLPWEGWMWHPERLTDFSNHDIQRIQKLFS